MANSVANVGNQIIFPQFAYQLQTQVIEHNEDPHATKREMSGELQTSQMQIALKVTWTRHRLCGRFCKTSKSWQDQD